jgi:hypothetical protein
MVRFAFLKSGFGIGYLARTTNAKCHDPFIYLYRDLDQIRASQPRGASIAFCVFVFFDTQISQNLFYQLFIVLTNP